MISVYITCRDKREAKKIARHLITRKLIVCANIFSIESLYEWKGKAVDSKEAAMLCKASDANYAKIEAAVKGMHSYENPCIVSFEWKQASKEYANWVRK